MSRLYVGNRVQNVDIGESPKKITRVTINVDSDHAYTAGDDTGRTIERECPWGSQEMADALLEKLSGVTYKPFSAERAMLSPAFEIGDPVTVGGVYSQIVGADINYRISGLVDIYAPELDETEDEYPSEKTQQSSIVRQLAGVRSAITKTTEEIRAEIADDINGLSSSVDIELDKIRQEVQGAEDAISYLEVDLEAISGRVEDAEGNIGALELEATNFGVRLEDAEGNIANLEVSTEEIEASVGKVSVRISDLEGLTVTDENGETKVNGSSIATNSIYGDSLHLGGFLSVYDGEYNNAIGGYLGYDSGFYGNTSGIGLRDAYENSEMVCTEWAARMSYSDDLGKHITQVVCGQELALSSVGSIQFSIGGDIRNVVAGLDGYSFYPANSEMTLGTSLLPWADVHGAGTSLGDLLRRIQKLEDAASA